MTIDSKIGRGQWSNRWMFILAATGSAVGLGNIWKFPYIAGENGGGAFVLVYLVCIALVGIPIMMAETLLGRRGHRNPVTTMESLSKEANLSKMWRYVGWLGVSAGFLILCFYSVVAGWALSYVVKAGTGGFAGLSAEQAGQAFSSLIGDPESLLAWHTIFMVMTCIVVARGVKGGLEAAIQILMPGLFLLLLVLLGYALNTGYFDQGLNFLFHIDFSELSGEAILVALGHSFFTLSLGMGAVMVYGSYLKKDVSIAKTTFAIAGLDTLIALLAGMVIFPVVFANGLEPGAGPGLLFQTLPLAFGSMPHGNFFGFLFFLLVVFGAWSSAIALIEPVVSWISEKTQYSRVFATTAIGITVWLLGIACLLSFNVWTDVTVFGKNFFDLADFLASNIMLPLGGLFIAIYAGWRLPKFITQDELAISSRIGYNLWLFVIRFIAPLAVIAIFANSLDISFVNMLLISAGVLLVFFLGNFFFRGESNEKAGLNKA